MRNLKIYLKYRDNDPAFEEIKNKNRLGVPSVIIDDEIYIMDADENSIENVYDKYIK